MGGSKAPETGDSARRDTQVLVRNRNGKAIRLTGDTAQYQALGA
jgi:hypothetical protein